MASAQRERQHLNETIFTTALSRISRPFFFFIAGTPVL